MHLLVQILFSSVNALESSIELGDDFSNRSLIMQSLNGNNNSISQKQKDILKERKLLTNVACLIEQIKKNNIENVELLLDAKVNPNDNYYAEYPIYIAAKTNNLKMIKLLYSRGAKLNKSFNSELYEAIKNKNREMIMFLLDNGANVNYRDSLTNKTPLYLAVKYNMQDIAEILIDKGARVDQQTYILIKKRKMHSILQKLG